MDAPNRDQPVAPTAGPLRWWQSRRVVIVALVFLYPVGLVLLLNAPRRGRLEKLVAGVLFLPAMAFFALLALKPFWEFGGRMSGPADLRLDFDRWSAPQRLEEDRARQKQLSDVPPRTMGPDAQLRCTDFRGPNRDGVYTGDDLSIDWQADPPRELWRHPIGGGYASFVVGGGRIYTIEQRRQREAVTCYDFAIGREVWVFDYPASFEETLGGDGPRATPTLHGETLYALGAEGHLHALNAETGELIGSANILADFDMDNLSWGLSGSPLVVDGKVIVTNSGAGSPSMIAYSLDLDRIIWKADAGKQGYSSPAYAVLAGRPQILNFSGDAVQGIDPRDGKVLWRYDWPTYVSINVAQPLVIGQDRVFISSGYGMGCVMLKITQTDGILSVEEIWSSRHMRNKFSSSVVYDGNIYGLNEAILGCINAETGERRWKGGRYDYGSLLLARGHLIVLSEDGELILVEATPDGHNEKGRVRIFDAGKNWNNFAIVGGRLFARNHKEMVCYDLRPAAPVARLSQ